VQPLTALQSEYSLMTRQPENDVIKVCEELGIGFVPYSPLSRAFLSGFLNQNTKHNASNDNRPSLPRYQPDAIRANWVMIDTLSEFGNPRGLTPAQVVLSGPEGQGFEPGRTGLAPGPLMSRASRALHPLVLEASGRASVSQFGCERSNAAARPSATASPDSVGTNHRPPSGSARTTRRPSSTRRATRVSFAASRSTP